MIHQDEFINALVHGKTWTFVEESESGGILALDQAGNVMDLETAQALFAGVMKFVEHYDNDNILDANYSRSIEAQHMRDVSVRELKNHKNSDQGVVYFLKGDNGLTKIGMSHKSSADDRIAQFEPKLPFSTDVVHLISCKNPRHVEATLHKHYGNKRVRGEWFALTDDDLNEIKQLNISSVGEQNG